MWQLSETYLQTFVFLLIPKGVSKELLIDTRGQPLNVANYKL